MKKEDWIKTSENHPENDALCLLTIEHELEGGSHIVLGYHVGGVWYNESKEVVYPTHYLEIVMPQ